MLAAFLTVPVTTANTPISFHVQAIGSTSGLSAGSNFQVEVQLRNTGNRSIGGITFMDVHFNNSVLEWQTAPASYNPENSSTHPFSAGAISTENILRPVAPQEIHNRGGATAVAGQHAARFSFDSQDNFTGQGQLLILNLRVRSGVTGSINTPVTVAFNAANAQVSEWGGSHIPLSSVTCTHTPVGVVTYQVTTASSPAGSPAVSGAGFYAQGNAVTLVAPASDTHNFVNWSLSPSVTLTSGTLTSQTISFNMGTQAITATANWTLRPTRTMNIINAPSGAPNPIGQNFSHGTPASNTGPVPEGRTVTVNAGTRTGFTFTNWTATGGVTFANASNATTTFVMGTSNVTATANWAVDNRPTLTIVNPGATGGGSTPAAGRIAAGANVTLNPGTRTGMTFTGWDFSTAVTFTNSTNANTPAARFNMPAGDLTVTANWIGPLNAHFLALGSCCCWAFQMTASEQPVDVRTATTASRSFTYTQPSGWGNPSAAFSGTAPGQDVDVFFVVPHGAGKGARITTVQRGTTTVTINKDLEPAFSYYLAEGASFLGLPATESVDQYGGMVTAAQLNAIGFDLFGYTLTPQEQSAIGSIPSGQNIIFNFAIVDSGPPTFGVTMAHSPAGTPLPTVSPSGSVAAGTQLTINAGTRAGFNFTGWTASPSGGTFGNAAGASTTYTTPASGTAVTITANWSADPQHQLTMSGVGSGGTTSGQRTQNTTVTLNPGTAPAGQMFSHWTASPSVSFSPNAQTANASFTMPAGPITVTANWQADTRPQLPVTVNLAGGNGSGGTGNFAAGDPVSIAAGTRSGWNFAGWVVAGGGPLTFTGGSISSANATFTMPSAPVAVRARWTQPGGTLPPRNLPRMPATMNATNTGVSDAAFWMGSYAADPFTVADFTRATHLVINFNKTMATTDMPTPNWGGRGIDVIWQGSDTSIGTTGSTGYSPGWHSSIDGNGSPSSAGITIIGSNSVSIPLATTLSNYSNFASIADDDWVQIGIVDAYWQYDINNFITSVQLTGGSGIGAEDPPSSGANAVTVSGTNGVNVGNFAQGTVVTVNAGTNLGAGNWSVVSGSGVSFANANSPITTFTMPAGAVQVAWTSTGATFTVTVNGTAIGSFAQGATVNYSAPAAPAGSNFNFWTATGITINTIEAATASSGSFTMPAGNVALTARFAVTGAGKGDINGDGAINSGDVTMLKYYIAATDKVAFLIANPTFNYANARIVTTNPTVSAADVSALQLWIATPVPNRQFP
jgi:uncharacterized repeat protein (TIGR02543 family)